jgi:23S rRNA (adenine2503-C2)-methyltransferase
MLIYDIDFSSIARLLNDWGEPDYRAKQVWQGLYRHLYDSPDQFTNLPNTLRAKLAEEFTFTPFTVKTYLDSSDKSTRKTLFELPDGNLIEAVLMRYGDPADEHFYRQEREDRQEKLKSSRPLRASRLNKKRRTLCISTQAGCAMGCVFCATGQMGFKRHLTSGEIVAQVMYYARMLRKADCNPPHNRLRTSSLWAWANPSTITRTPWRRSTVLMTWTVSTSARAA